MSGPAIGTTEALDENAVLGALQTVYDGCCEEREISIVDMGLVDRIEIEDGRVEVTLVLTTGWCPFSSRMITQAVDRVRALPGVTDAEFKIDWGQVWSPDRASADIAGEFRLLPEPTGPRSRERLLAEYGRPPAASRTTTRKESH